MSHASPYKTFVFEKYHFDPTTQTLQMYYSFDGKLKFTETVVFEHEIIPGYSAEALNRALFGVFILSGVSYYKAYLTPKFILKTGSLSQPQAEFFNNTYLQGLGEFLYRNKLDPPRVAQFTAAGTPPQAVEIDGLSGSLVPIGGGKDSLVTVAILAEAGKDFSIWRVNPEPWVRTLMDEIGQPQQYLKRTLSPNLFDLKNALNGHIPITGIVSLLALVSAILSGKQSVVMSNESSADYGNTDYKGLKVNHQYSKSLEFERALQHYIHGFISPSLEYFSLLRPLSGLKVAELFALKCFTRYRGKFSSCNRNFTQNNRGEQPRWCGECPKCASVFSLLAPFVPKDKLVKLFGKDLFADPNLRLTFNQLLGTEGIKPFECVADILETRVALKLAGQSGGWPELAEFEIPQTDFDYQKLGQHAYPPVFKNNRVANL